MLNQLKAIFIILYVPVTAIIGLQASYQLITSGLNLAWLGVCITTFIIIWHFIKPRFIAIPRSKAFADRAFLCMLAGATLAIIGNFNPQQDNTLPLFYMVILFVGWLLYEFWYKRIQYRHTLTLETGKTIPAFTLPNQDGEIFHSESLAGHHSILVFFRGCWCPAANAQLQELARKYRQALMLGTQLVFITTHDTKHLQKIAQAYQVPAVFLIDKDCNLATKLGIEQDNATPLLLQLFGHSAKNVIPTTVLTNTNKQIVYYKVASHYHDTPEPDTLFKLINYADA